MLRMRRVARLAQPLQTKNGGARSFSAYSAPEKTMVPANFEGNGGMESRTGLMVAVFGASGFLGRYACANIGSHGHHLIPCTRGDPFEIRHLKTSCALGKFVPQFFGPRDEDSIRDAIRGCNVVVNLVGKHYASVNFTLDESNHKVPAMIARCARLENVYHLVHVSSLYADPNGPSEFARAKALGEQKVREEFPGACIIRAGTLYGEEDRYLNWYGTAASTNRIVPVFDGGKGMVNPVFVGDVADAVYLAATNWEDTVDKTYDLPGPDAYTQKQVAEFVMETVHDPNLNIQPTFVNLPKQVGKFTGRIAENWFNPTVTEDWIERLCADELIDGKNESWEAFGLSPARFERKAINYLFRFRTQGHFVETPSRFADQQNEGTGF